MNQLGYREQWARLLSANRVSFPLDANGNQIKDSTKLVMRLGQLEEFRTQFETDYCRIIFSSPFRRLAGKTQVHPFSEIDYVHNRLTHSLEVSSVAYSLSRRVGRFIAKDRGDIDESQIDDVSWIARAAGLAHDIGNPPFGHVGEDAIRTWANGLDEESRKRLGNTYMDFARFDGNAQGFRMLSRPDLRKTTYYRLTAATLGAMIKYPFDVDDASSAYYSKNKFAALSTEKPILKMVMEDVGLDREGKYIRHPLSYLTEAADDICYRVSDFEDAVVMGILREEDVRDLFLDGMTFEDKQKENDKAIQHIRARSVGLLIDDFAQCFCDNYDAIMQGVFDGDLKSHIASRWKGVLRRIDDLYKRVFAERKKVLAEVGAYRRITSVLNGFKCLWDCDTTKPYNDLPFMCKRVVDLAFGDKFYVENQTKSPEWWAHTVLDHVVGMTDEYMRTMSEMM